MGLYSIVRSARWAMTNYPADRYARLLQESMYWTRGELENFRNAKIRKLIAHCYENVPYYRRVMEERDIKPFEIGTAEDLSRLPILTKEDIRRSGKELLASNLSQMKVSWTKTGGTTGEPMRVCKNVECAAWSGMCYERGLGWGGKSVDEPAVWLFGGSLGVDKTSVRSRIATVFRQDLLIPAFELRIDNALSYCGRIQRSGYRFAVGYASALYRLATLANQLNQKIEFKAVFPTAEAMSPEWEAIIRDTFKCSLKPYYGCGEVNSLGFTSLETDAYFIPEEHALLEVMRADDSIHLAGTGRFLVTDLDNYAMPIIRYVNGDVGTIAAYSGRFPFQRIEKLEGRYNSLLMTEKGDLISGVIGAHIFRLTSSVETYRVIQEEPLRVLIKIVPKGELTSDDYNLILELFAKYLGSRMKIIIDEVESLPALPSGKSVFVVNQCLQDYKQQMLSGSKDKITINGI